jgi:mRNA-degrading endonuclease RelE of RelBE toxin-antitoxin system
MENAPRRFTIVYAQITKEHLRAIEAKYYSLIRDAVAEQLSFEPTIETRNRKPLKRPVVFMATWEIRFGPHNRFRVYYDVDLEQTIVSILAIGSKHGNRVVIGREEIQL